MDSVVTSQLVAVGATLCGVVLTLFTNAYLERRRARDAHQLESLRLRDEHAKWLRDERMRAYATFSLTGEELQRGADQSRRDSDGEQGDCFLDDCRADLQGV